MRNNEIFGEPTKSHNQKWIAIIRNEGTLKVPYNNVLYIEQKAYSLFIQTDNEGIQVNGRLRDISPALEEPFCQCHSYLVINLEKVYVMTKGKITFANRTELFLGRESFSKTRKKFTKYLLNQQCKH